MFDINWSAVPTIDVTVIRYQQGIRFPKRSTLGSAGYDIFSPINTSIAPHEVVRIKLGFGLKVAEGFYASLQTRSSLSIKHGIVLANGTEGVVDSDYTDEIILALYNRSDETFEIAEGDRIAQVLFKPYYTARVLNLEDPNVDSQHVSLDPNSPDIEGIQTRSGGLGSTGK